MCLQRNNAEITWYHHNNQTERILGAEIGSGRGRYDFENY
jgi:hypothetical protein